MNTKKLKIDNLDTPIRACWLVTNRCNYACQFCHRVLDRRELSFDEALKVADRLIEAGIKKLTFSGGEPMMWEGLYELMGYVKKRGVMTMMITNASFMNNELLEKYAEVLDWITFSIDGSTEEMQQLMTRDPGHLVRTLKLIGYIEKMKLPLGVKINTVFSSINRDDILDIGKLVASLPSVERWKVFQFYPIRGLAVRYQKKFVVSDKVFTKVRDKVLSEIPSSDRLSVFFADNQDLEGTYFTLAPDGVVFLSYEGNDYFVGDLKKQTVDEIWANSLYNHKAHGEQAGWVLKYLKNNKLGDLQNDSGSNLLYEVKRSSGVLGGGVL